MTDQQTVSGLTPDDVERLRRQRLACERYIGDDASRANYRTAAGKLGLIRALLSAHTFGVEQTYELQCMGIVLGDAMVQELAFEWVIVEDSSGRDPAIRVPGTSILLFPLTMISKRLERAEEVDVFDLFNGIAAQVEGLRR